MRVDGFNLKWLSGLSPDRWVRRRRCFWRSSLNSKNRVVLWVGPLAGVALLAGCSALFNAYESSLADHLSETGAKMYGAYWCPHCARQKDAFRGALDRVPYIECDPNGYNAQSERCAAEGIAVYPTWVIDGEQHLGVQPLGKLAELSGFEAEGGLSTAEESFEEAETEGGYSPAE